MQTVSLLDSDEGRRQSIWRELRQIYANVQPYDSLTELSAHWPKGSPLIVHDKDNVVEDVINAMYDRGEWNPIVVFHEEISPSRIVDSLFQGVIDYYRWPFSSTELSERIQRFFVDEAGLVEQNLRVSAARKKLSLLTEREHQVLNKMIEGATSKEIARELGISHRTVEVHRRAIIGRLKVRSAVDVVRIAVEGAFRLTAQAQTEPAELR